MIPLPGRTGLVLLLALAPLGRGLAQVPIALGQKSEPLITSQFAWTIGAALFLSAWMDTEVREDALESQGSWSDGAAALGKTFGEGNYLFPVLGLSYAVGKLAGVETMSHVAGHAFVATATAGLAAVAIKGVVGRSRPYVAGDPAAFEPFSFKNESFPSGHTAIAFALATAMAAETPDRLSDVFLYAGATLTGLSRVYHDRHWLTDVVAGAGVGYLAGRWATRDHRQIPINVGPGGVMIQLSF